MCIQNQPDLFCLKMRIAFELFQTTKETWKFSNVVENVWNLFWHFKNFRKKFYNIFAFESSEKMWKYINYEFDVYFTKMCLKSLKASRLLKSLKFLKIWKF